MLRVRGAHVVCGMFYLSSLNSHNWLCGRKTNAAATTTQTATTKMLENVEIYLSIRESEEEGPM
jgi:hypothetical protein